MSLDSAPHPRPGGSEAPSAGLGAAVASPQEQLAFLRWTAGPALEPRQRAAWAEWLVHRALNLDPGPYRREGSVLGLAAGTLSLVVRSAAQAQLPAAGRAGQSPAGVSFALGPRSLSHHVFCLLVEPDPALADPRDADQWRFWLVPTATLHPDRQTIGLQALRRAHGEGLSLAALAERIRSLRPAASG